jgi:hypothetical protein
MAKPKILKNRDGAWEEREHQMTNFFLGQVALHLKLERYLF